MKPENFEQVKKLIEDLGKAKETHEELVLSTHFKVVRIGRDGTSYDGNAEENKAVFKTLKEHLLGLSAKRIIDIEQKLIEL
ncbi:MAG: hypothetical protein Q8K92_08435 [Leadbetterella sp.]|nr:hypothetical protein [Leadbetterella sp.]